MLLGQCLVVEVLNICRLVCLDAALMQWNPSSFLEVDIVVAVGFHLLI